MLNLFQFAIRRKTLYEQKKLIQQVFIDD